MLLSVFKFKTIQFWAMTRISKTHGINKRLLENNETSKTFYFFKFFFIKRKFVSRRYSKTTTSQNMTQRRKSSTSVHPSLDVVHGNSLG